MVKIIWDSKRNWTIVFLIMVILLMIFINLKTNNTETLEKTPQPVSIDLEEIKKRGSLNVYIENGSISYFIYKGQPMGFDLELLEALAQDLDLKLKLIAPKKGEDIYKMLDKGNLDLISKSLHVTKNQLKNIDFTHHYMYDEQVLVQRKPKYWTKYTHKQIEDSLIRNQTDLIGKSIYVDKKAHLERLQNLSNEIGGDIQIIYNDNYNTDELIKMVAQGKIDYTVANKSIALISQTYFQNLDVETPISFPQKIAWGIRLNAPKLKDTIDQWLIDQQTSITYTQLYSKYFKNPRAYKYRIKSNFHSETGGNISRYDDFIKKYAKSINWDWRLLSALIYKESKFDATATSWVGARGLMQLLPVTAKEMGLDSTFIEDPEMSLKAGTKYLKYLQKLWAEIPDSTERIKFILASYNVGGGHVKDAVRLAKKYNTDENQWKNVGHYLKLKSQSTYYRDPVVRNGYCRGSEPFNYVVDILEIFNHYKKLFPTENS